MELTITKVLLILLAIILITSCCGHYLKKYNRDNIEDLTIESFDNMGNSSVKEHYTNIYDKFYSSIYDELFNSALKNEYEAINIKRYTLDKYPDKKSVHILDAGCGTGQHLKIFDKYKYKCTGIDTSMKMLTKARTLNPGIELIKGDFHNKKIFKKRQFSHITCLFYTIYYSDTPNKVFKNFNYWLKPKGFLCLHLVNPEKFDPILEKSSSLIPLFSPQKHTHNRQTKTSLHFNNFKYIANWSFSKNDVTFVENFLFKNKTDSRRNIHKFKMYNANKYIKLAKNNGFKLIKVIDLTPVNHEFNNIYMFKKIYGS